MSLLHHLEPCLWFFDPLSSISPSFPFYLLALFFLAILLVFHPLAWQKLITKSSFLWFADTHTWTRTYKAWSNTSTDTNTHRVHLDTQTCTLDSRLPCVSDCSLLRGCGRCDDVELLWRLSVAWATLSQQPNVAYKHGHTLTHTSTQDWRRETGKAT